MKVIVEAMLTCDGVDRWAQYGEYDSVGEAEGAICLSDPRPLVQQIVDRNNGVKGARQYRIIIVLKEWW